MRELFLWDFTHQGAKLGSAGEAPHPETPHLASRLDQCSRCLPPPRHLHRGTSTEVQSTGAADKGPGKSQGRSFREFFQCHRWGTREAKSRRTLEKRNRVCQVHYSVGKKIPLMETDNK